MSTITPISGMPVDEVHGAMKSRSVVFSIFYADGFIDTQLIKESGGNIELSDLADVPSHKKHGAAVATSTHAWAMFDDGFVKDHTSYDYNIGTFLCPCPPGCNPLINPLCT